MFYIVVLTIVLILIWTVFSLKERFSPVPYNTDNIKDDYNIGTINPVSFDDARLKEILETFNNFPLDIDVPPFTGVIPVEQDFHPVQITDRIETDFAIKKFIDQLNYTSGYSFSLLENSNIIGEVASKQNQILQRYDSFFFVYDKKQNSTKRINLKFMIEKFPDFPGKITILKATSGVSSGEQAPILPPAEDPFVNTHLAKVKNKLDRASPYNSDESDFLLTKEDIDIEEERRKLVQKIRESYRCLGIPQAEAIDNAAECLNFGGVWDKPANTNEECPFYQANKNYDNFRGGVRQDYCEMPSGVKIKGFRNFEKSPEDYKPLCYNCNTDLIGQGSLGLCCSVQQFPDYKFPGDQVDRYNSRAQLSQRGLSVN